MTEERIAGRVRSVDGILVDCGFVAHPVLARTFGVVHMDTLMRFSTPAYPMQGTAMLIEDDHD